ncbi:MAG: NAD(P)H-hydrate dehydratase [Oscillospiraceae bacterium]|jgi:NAD(P)H-hydrate epimerase|nr:NAD(P)H-hydrate dehydratase [Oscillospiraceae bacterium]
MQSVTVVTENDIKLLLPARDPRGNKGTFGHVLSVCGSERYQGAAVLAALGAVHGGAGLVTAAFPRAAYGPVAAKLAVTPLLPLPGNRQGTLHVSALPPLRAALPGKTALLLGCGLGLNADTKAVVESLLGEAALPTILDADGINAAAAHIDILKRRACRTLVLTPHPGEMARLCRSTAEEVERNRAETACRFAEQYQLVLVLKGAQTIVAAPGQPPAALPFPPNSGLAKGGSGDLLAGIIAAFLAQGLPARAAALCGVYLHSLAAARAAERYSARGMTAVDCIEELKRI